MPGGEVFPGGEDVAGEIAAGRYGVLHVARGADGEPAERGALLTDLIAGRHGAVSRVALGEPGAGVAGLHDAYRGALAALGIGPVLDPAARVHTVRELRFPHRVAAATRCERARHAAARSPRRAARAPDWSDTRARLIAWAECGCHLVRTAERLRIHRNTLPHRLGRTAALSAHDVRDPRTAIALHPACLADAPDALDARGA
ncbi:CdaR family transcriptional regulator [Streptomyces sp. VRA16 Mangrove soil]|uniref:PucR family transcriptional regulator n=1 Tax=Streptomyces sp. VRA16 Mangrove soil TaxID=2817434 RepID=UPI001A9D7D72|nr:helix-turn-helix domain-containing protein [Streptomyces sp. VRA16 Mangrove soil]MBO1332239.1 helix-turn-helix domain-containing protein [Streptomyces sp. VRA16 Mangrove soil]